MSVSALDRARRLSVALLLLMAAQSASGLALRTEYRDVDWIRATWIANDLVTLFAAVPLLAWALRAVGRGSRRGFLLWLGLLGYAAYNYAFYLLGAALNAFFPLYVVAVVLASAALILALGGGEAGRWPTRPGSRIGHRLTAGWLIFVAGGLSVVWTLFWARIVFGGFTPPTGVEAFRLVAALDLTLMVPAMATGGVLLWRGRGWGWLIASVASVQGTLYLVVLSTSSLVAISRGLVEAPGELPIWLPLGVGTGLAAARLLASVGGRGDASHPRGMEKGAGA